jgi:hypothetical protein
MTITTENVAMEREHARLAPSASHRWMECPGSIRMSAGMERVSSFYADEGSAAHFLAQHCLNGVYEPSLFAGWWVVLDPPARLVPEPKGRYERAPFEITEEMVDGVSLYFDYCESLHRKGVEVSIEEWLSLDYLKIDGLDGGTGDFTAYDPKTKVLEVVDFKFGRGVAVHPKENPQALCYALGAVRRYHNRGLSKLRITIVQPRAPSREGPIRTWEADVNDLLEFEAALKTAALATLAVNAPLKAGDWCKFCPAAAVCPANRALVAAIADSEFGALLEPVDMTPKHIAKVLKDAHLVEAWLARVKEFAHNEALSGRVPPGFKLVNKRATRRWIDDAAAAEALLASGLSEDAVYETKIRTPAKIEPLVSGKNKSERAKVIEPYLSRVSSGVKLVDESDPAPAVKTDGSEFNDLLRD